VARVSDVLWSAEKAPATPSSFEYKTTGWLLHDGELRKADDDRAPDVGVGDRYVVPLVRVNFGDGPEWWPLTPAAQLPVESGKIDKASWAGDVGKELEGMTLDEVTTAVVRQHPAPEVAKYADSRPQDRIEAVQRDRLEQERREHSDDAGG